MGACECEAYASAKQVESCMRVRSAQGREKNMHSKASIQSANLRKRLRAQGHRNRARARLAQARRSGLRE